MAGKPCSNTCLFGVHQALLAVTFGNAGRSRDLEMAAAQPVASRNHGSAPTSCPKGQVNKRFHVMNVGSNTFTAMVRSPEIIPVVHRIPLTGMTQDATFTTTQLVDSDAVQIYHLAGRRSLPNARVRCFQPLVLGILWHPIAKVTLSQQR